MCTASNLRVCIPKQAVSTIVPNEAVGASHMSGTAVHHVQAHRIHIKMHILNTSQSYCLSSHPSTLDLWILEGNRWPFGGSLWQSLPISMPQFSMNRLNSARKRNVLGQLPSNYSEGSPKLSMSGVVDEGATSGE